MMKIIVDDKIPYIRPALTAMGAEVAYLPGSQISNADVIDADALVVRTRTRVDEKLLAGSRVSFVATATIGFDHLDTAYLERQGIRWMSCPGCNAGAVAQYLHSVFILLQREKGLVFDKTTLGIVGCGHVGSRVRSIAQALGMRTLVCDPPLQEQGVSGLCDLSAIEQQADVITFHVPLSKEGRHPTFLLAGTAFFQRLKKSPILINTSRGSVVDNTALLAALNEGLVHEVVIDTWENEPAISRPLLNKVYLGTPHIAGYSADGKVNADNMVIDGLCSHFGLKNQWKLLPPRLLPPMPIIHDAADQALQLYDPRIDSRNLKNSPESFEDLRGNYRLRREKFD
ncbi:MAG: 4-phosphoerythronate dehydrogenase [Selenomonas sp.]|nr:4-phosphoerythronate dehydrogenase [Selenomonas sp.]